MILVTGGTGQIGSRLLLNLTKNKAYKVRAIYRNTQSLEKIRQLFVKHSDSGAAQFDTIEWIQADLSNIPALEKAFEGVTFVFHCAGLISFQPQDFDKLIEVNVQGTANIVITILDKNGKPVAGATQRSRVVRDGIVVDFMGAIGIVRKLKEDLEEKLGIQITEGYTAIPPGVEQGSVKAIVNVIESAGIDVLKVVDEPTAASYVLGITDGVVVDLGGGTTGISILEKGKVVFVADEPTGGTHMTLVLAGSYGVDFETAEDIKTDKKKEKEVFVQITPVLQKMASIVKKYIKDRKQKYQLMDRKMIDSRPEEIELRQRI